MIVEYLMWRRDRESTFSLHSTRASIGARATALWHKHRKIPRPHMLCRIQAKLCIRCQPYF